MGLSFYFWEVEMKIDNERELDCKDFELYLVSKTEMHSKALIAYDQYIFLFENDYGASVLSYKIKEHNMRFLNVLPTHMRGFEVAVLKLVDDGVFDLTFDTPIGNDVIRNLDNEEVVEVLKRIKEL